jgi:hypothetical protein
MQVLLHGFVKKSAKTLATDLQVARDRRSKYEVAVINERFLGSDFDEFLRKEGFIDQAEAVAANRVIAFQIAEEMKSSSITKTELARRMNTSRPVVDRPLDPSSQSVTLSTLGRAASAVGKSLKIGLS